MGQPSVSPFFATGDNRIDALFLPGDFGVKWGGPAGTGVTLTYSVRTDGSVYVDDYSELNEPVRGQGFTVTQAQTDAFDAAIAAWGAVANINFVPVVESGDVSADIRFGFTQATDLVDQESDVEIETQSIVRGPGVPAAAGDIWFAPSQTDLNYTATVNGGGYNLMLNAIGTAVFGLGNATEPGLNGATLSEVENTQSFTVISENASPGVEVEETSTIISFPTTPMIYDILAAQALYGPNMTHNADDTVYVFAPGQQLYQTIWDAGGTDVIDWSNQTQPVLIDLNDGSYSTLGPPRSDGVTANQFTVAIAFNAFIENARGGVDSDTIIGNELDNFILANSGADSVRGFLGNDVIYGNIGADIIYGNQDADVIFGGQDADLLYGGQDPDLLYGNFANDILYGNLASDILFGGADSDILYGGKGADQLAGNRGNDILYGNKDADLLSGGPGDDVLLGGPGDDLLGGDDGNDELVGGDGNDTLNGQAGNDNLTGGVGLDELNGGDGDDNLDGGIEDDLLFGGAGDDVINGGDNDDTIYGGDGSDDIDGGAGSDFIEGGNGADQMSGGLGNDTFIINNTGQIASDVFNGGTDLVQTQVNLVLGSFIENAIALGPNSIILTGNDLDNRLEGNDRDNQLLGETGNDTLIGGLGADTLDGGQGTDQLSGGFGNDTYILTGDEDAVIEGATGGFDTVLISSNVTIPDNIEQLILTGQAEATGNDGNNIITGSSGSDLLSGRGGADTIDGAEGADTIVGGSGDDSLTGGGGADRFVYTSSNSGNDVITDYEAGLDILTFDNGISDASRIAVGVDTVVTLNSGAVLTFLGVAPGDITVEDLMTM